MWCGDRGRVADGLGGVFVGMGWGGGVVCSVYLLHPENISIYNTYVPIEKVGFIDQGKATGKQ